jgi:hypothetical protein
MIWGDIIIGCKFLEEIGGLGLYPFLEIVVDLQGMECYGLEQQFDKKMINNTIF